MKFKVGDKVKVLDGQLFPLGTIGRIAKIEGNSYLVDNKKERWWFNENSLKLVGKEVSMKDCKWGVKYERDEDPVEFFKSRKDAEKRVTELLDDSDVDKSEIYVFEVGETFKVDRPVSFKLVKFK